MKAITLWQPWATLLACGAKQYETRSWATEYRGPIAIHAAKRRLDIQDLDGNMCIATLESLQLVTATQMMKSLPYGCIIATAELVGVYCIAAPPDKPLFRDDFSFMFYNDKSSLYSPAPLNVVSVQPNLSIKFGLGKNEMLFGDWMPGRYAWEFSNMKLLSEPVPAKGKQRLWNWEEDIICSTSEASRWNRISRQKR